MKFKRTILFFLAIVITMTSVNLGTVAWFTDRVTSGKNDIKGGNLDAVLMQNGEELSETDVLFNEVALWEPGVVAYENLTIKNAGDLAFKYQLYPNVLGCNHVVETGKSLMDVLKFAIMDGHLDANSVREEITKTAEWSGVGSGHAYTSDLLEKNKTKDVTMVIWWEPTDYDNDLNLNNGKSLSDNGKFLSINMSAKLDATQAEFEADSFGTDYDKDAFLPKLPLNIRQTMPVTVVDGKVDVEATISAGDVQAVIPAGVLVNDGVTSLTLVITSKDKSDANIRLEENEDIAAYDVKIEGVSKNNTVPMAITLGEVAPKYMNIGPLKIYHEGREMDSYANGTADSFAYDPATGVATIYLATFSEIALVADEENAWEGKFDYGWYTNAVATADAESDADYIIANADQLAAFGAIVGGMNGQTQDSFSGKKVKLIADVNLGDKESENNPDIIFYPIGYYNSTGSYDKTSGGSVTSSVSSFEGTFNGNGHTIANFYQNTWEMFGDYNDGYSGTPNYYKDAMGLFGYVNGGTVKNLTVDNFSSDGEYTPTGVIAAYAVNSTFENIAITNCNPRVYNTGNGGIVGIGGNSDDPDTYKLTFTNITIDNTNKITALWGSWDVACGGLVGMFRGAGHVYMTNCHVAAQMDVYNDVCGNYQYYWYRYSGMMVGTNKNMITDKDGYTVPETSKFHAENCTVHFGEWNDYYYCELVDNSLASYTHDHQFSRLERVNALPESADGTKHYYVKNSDGTITCRHFIGGKLHNHEDSGIETVNGVEGVRKEDKTCVYLPFNQLFTGYGWGVKHIPVYNGEDYAFEGITILDRTTASSEVKFEKADTAKDSYSDGTTVTIGELFKAATIADEKLSIKGDKVQVTVSPVGTESTVSGTYEANTTDWTQGKLTFTGVGAATITITDYYFCTPTTIEVTIVPRENEVKFEKLFIDDFLYRVGNQNTVALGSLFAAKEDVEIGTVEVTITEVKGNVAGTYTSNATWTNGTIEFTGTGVVKVTITDNDYCTPTEIYLEVVDATNVTEYSELKNQTSVLLDDIIMSANSAYYLSDDATLYGNGFTFDCTNGAYTATSSVSENYVVGLVNAHLDNVQIVGKVYTEYGAQASKDYNRALVVSKGNSTISNCYLSNTASPVRLVEGSLEIKGSTLKGGNFANIDVRNGHLTIEDVTTINQALGNDKADDGSTVIGLGIVVYYENVDAALTSVTINGTLTQYNHVSSNDKFEHEYATQFVNQMMTGDYAEFRYEVNGVKWANTGIVAMTSIKPTDNRTDTGNYTGRNVSFMSKDGHVYTVKPTEGSIAKSPADYATFGQGVISPIYSFDYTTKNYVAKTEGSNDYCYYENGKVQIAMDQGDTFNWDPFILTAEKYGKTLDYSVVMDGKTYTSDSKIAFNTSGDYVVTYSYTDGNNYRIDEYGEPEAYETDYTKTVNISVSVIAPTAQHATFTFADTDTATEKVTVGDKTYISAKDVSATDKEWGYITVNGTKIFYPITEAQMKKNLLGTEVQVYYYVFKDAVTITDYKDGGTGGEQKYDSSTTTMPSNLTVVNGMEAKYTAISSACVDISKLTKDGPSGEVWDFSASTTVSGTTTYNKCLAHSSPSGLTIKSGTRDYDAITVAQFSYTDAAGATYYYFVGYFMPNQVSSGGSSGGSTPCVTPDTLVTLADGSRKEIQYVTYDDQLLVWDFYKGEYAAVPAAIIFDHGADENTVIKLGFEDGTTVKVVNLHQFMDVDLNAFVSIDAESAESYIGHHFVKRNGDTYTEVRLVDVEITEEYVEAWGIISAQHYNILVEDMISADYEIKDLPLFSYFAIGEDMMYDAAAMQADIEEYGLYAYEDFAEYLTPEQFEAFNVKYMKVSVGKGQYTYEGILELIGQYLA